MSDKLHSITMEDRRHLSLWGVTDTESFDENCVIIYTSAGIMTIKGHDLKVGELSIGNGEMSVDGEINSISYGDRDRQSKSGLLGKIFR